MKYDILMKFYRKATFLLIYMIQIIIIILAPHAHVHYAGVIGLTKEYGGCLRVSRAVGVDRYAGHCAGCARRRNHSPCVTA